MPKFYYVSAKPIAVAIDETSTFSADTYMPEEDTITLYTSLIDAKKVGQAKKGKGNLIFEVAGENPAQKNIKRSKSNVAYFKASTQDYKFVSIIGEHLDYENYNFPADSVSEENNQDLESSIEVLDVSEKKPAQVSPPGPTLRTVTDALSKLNPFTRFTTQAAASPLLPAATTQATKLPFRARFVNGAKAFGSAAWKATKKYGPAAAVVVGGGVVFAVSGGSAAFVAWMQSLAVPALAITALNIITPVVVGIVGYGLIRAGWAGLKAFGSACNAGYQRVANKVVTIQKERATARIPQEKQKLRVAVEELGRVAIDSDTSKKPKWSLMVNTEQVVSDLGDPRDASKVLTLAYKAVQKMKPAVDKNDKVGEDAVKLPFYREIGNMAADAAQRKRRVDPV